MKIFAFLFTLLIFTATLSTSTFCKDKKQKKVEKLKREIIYATLDLKQDYEIIQVVVGYLDFSFAFAADLFVKGHAKAWKDIEAEALKIDSDSVIGIRVEFKNVSKEMIISLKTHCMS